jgi:hypothetical protein
MARALIGAPRAAAAFWCGLAQQGAAGGQDFGQQLDLHGLRINDATIGQGRLKSRGFATHQLLRLGICNGGFVCHSCENRAVIGCAAMVLVVA